MLIVARLFPNPSSSIRFTSPMNSSISTFFFFFLLRDELREPALDAASGTFPRQLLSDPPPLLLLILRRVLDAAASAEDNAPVLAEVAD
mmetsp:Transcript_6842/g.21288  ORF Transcript_6842/g.21288 Transcript_6842/m.21288 type:complete len:89 (+) Transcript_6842:58-324(+)